ncbi:MAG: TerB family tellurite resistance protein [Candidatus Marinimicrobia bacterium]|nr:TerB family tellurite resistance protein [Candidatus Neomarinimicrobiota bacterium]
MLGFEKKYPILYKKGIMGAANIGVFAPIVVFLMDRIMIADNEITPQESDMFDKLSNKYGDLFGFGPGNFIAEVMRIGNIYENYISTSEDARMTWEAVEFVGSEFDEEQKNAMVDILVRLATSDEYIDKKEMSILYAAVMACHDEIDAVTTVFSGLYENIIKVYNADHQMAKALMSLMNFIAEDPKSVKMSILGLPDPRAEGNIPPVLFTDEEFADWIMIISLIRASQQRRALMNQTRVYWNIAKTGDGRTVGAQKGLIRFFSISNPNDDQIDESLDFTRAWCKAIREGIGNVPMIDEQIFEIIVYGENEQQSILPDFEREGLWKITCKKISSGIELHAFDITGNSKTYWCPETAKELAAKIDLEPNWINGTFPIEQNERNEIIASVREYFSE